MFHLFLFPVLLLNIILQVFSQANIHSDFHGVENTSILNTASSQQGNFSSLQNLSFSGQDGENLGRKLEAVVPVHPFTHNLIRKIAPFFSFLSHFRDKCWTLGYNEGTCFPRRDCLAKGGRPYGFCAGGHGVCCVFSYSCDSVTAFNRTYFVNPEFPNEIMPSSHPTTCTHTVRKLDGVCQLRLDFEHFQLESPQRDGNCWQDGLYIDGVDFPLPSICGNLGGHHLYLPIGFGPEVTYYITLSSGKPWRKWKIRTTKIKCVSQLRAPGGCLQYYLTTHGHLTSFNYWEHAPSNINGLNYAVCIRREKGFCAIKWTECHHRRRKRSSSFEEARNDPEKKRWTGSRSEKNRWSWMMQQDDEENDSPPVDSTINIGKRNVEILEKNSTMNRSTRRESLLGGSKIENSSSIGRVVLCLKKTPGKGALIPCGRKLRNKDWEVSNSPYEKEVIRSSRKEINYVNNSMVDDDTRSKEGWKESGDAFYSNHMIQSTQKWYKQENRYKHQEGKKGEEDNDDDVEDSYQLDGTLPSGHQHRHFIKSNKNYSFSPPLSYNRTKDVGEARSKSSSIKKNRFPLVTPQTFKSKGIRPKSSSTKKAPFKYHSPKLPNLKKSKGNSNKNKKFNNGLPKRKLKPKFKPKRPVKLPKRKKKPSISKSCRKKVAPIPFPLPVVLPFPLGGGGGGGGGGGHSHKDHGWGWSGHMHHGVVSSVEPYLIRIMTNGKVKHGLKSVCLDWEQIPCDAWNHPQHHEIFPPPFHLHDEF